MKRLWRGKGIGDAVDCLNDVVRFLPRPNRCNPRPRSRVETTSTSVAVMRSVVGTKRLMTP